MKTTEAPVVVEHLLDNTIQEVWSAISEHSQMIQWYFDNIPNFKAEVGFKTQFNVKAPSRDFLHIWEVTEVIPEERLIYRWNFEALQGESYSIFELSEVNEQTKLTVRTEVVEDFDDSIPEFQRESCDAGWNYFIKETASNFLVK